MPDVPHTGQQDIAYAGNGPARSYGSPAEERP